MCTYRSDLFMPFIEKILELLEYGTHIDTLLILAVCGFPLTSVYNSDSSNRAILIQNEDFKRITDYWFCE